jgi:predicted nuclease with TOPRIM domain
VSIIIAIALFGSRGSGPKKTANLAQTLDELLKKNQQLMKRNQHLLGEIGSLRNNPLNSNIPMEQLQTLDHLTDKNQQLRKKNQELVSEVAAVGTKLVGPSEASTKVKAEKNIAKIAAWIVSCVRKARM